MSFALEVLTALIALSAAMGVAWLVAERTGRSGWIDAIWTFAAGLAGMALSLSPASLGTLRPLLVAGLAALWSVRLGFHIVWRTAHGRDDPRYRQLRVEWGDKGSGRLFGFFRCRRRRLFAIAAFGERAADRQLARFGETPRISPRSAVQGSGVTLAIRTISLSGSSGSPLQ